MISTYTSAPSALPNGSHIVIEARPSEEITHFKGTRVVDERVQVCELRGAREMELRHMNALGCIY
eukprot:999161-Pelagomonas_calceolata.AAC.3